MPGIRSNIQSHFLFPVSTCCCENARTRALRYLYTGAVYPYLYMKQLCTRLVCCAVSRLNHAARFPFIFTGKRASIHCTSVRLSSPFAFGSGSLTLGTDLLTKFKLRLRLAFTKCSVSALTLFVLRILADYSDASFSFNNLAFFTNWFY